MFIYRWIYRGVLALVLGGSTGALVNGVNEVPGWAKVVAALSSVMSLILMVLEAIKIIKDLSS